MRRLVGILLVCLLLWCNVVAVGANRYIRQPHLEEPGLSEQSMVYFFPLRHGDATLISDHQGHNILVDTGSQKEVRDLLEHLRRCHIKALDSVILTVPRPEHTGGLAVIASRLPIHRILMPSSMADHFAMPATVGQVTRQGLAAGDNVQFSSDVSMRVIGPSSEQVTGKGDPSLVFQLRVRSTTILFAGDISPTLESQYARSSIQSKILKVPDHGRRGSVIEPFLRAVDPQVAIIGGGDGSGTPLPSDELVERLMETWIDVYPVTHFGVVTVLCGPTSYRVVRA